MAVTDLEDFYNLAFCSSRNTEKATNTNYLGSWASMTISTTRSVGMTWGDHTNNILFGGESRILGDGFMNILAGTYYIEFTMYQHNNTFQSQNICFDQGTLLYGSELPRLVGVWGGKDVICPQIRRFDQTTILQFMNNGLVTDVESVFIYKLDEEFGEDLLNGLRYLPADEDENVSIHGYSATFNPDTLPEVRIRTSLRSVLPAPDVVIGKDRHNVLAPEPYNMDSGVWRRYQYGQLLTGKRDLVSHVPESSSTTIRQWNNPAFTYEDNIALTPKPTSFGGFVGKGRSLSVNLRLGTGAQSPDTMITPLGLYEPKSRKHAKPFVSFGGIVDYWTGATGSTFCSESFGGASRHPHTGTPQGLNSIDWKGFCDSPLIMYYARFDDPIVEGKDERQFRVSHVGSAEEHLQVILSNSNPTGLVFTNTTNLLNMVSIEALDNRSLGKFTLMQIQIG